MGFTRWDPTLGEPPLLRAQPHTWLQLCLVLPLSVLLGLPTHPSPSWSCLVAGSSRDRDGGTPKGALEQQQLPLGSSESPCCGAGAEHPPAVG